MSTKSKVAVASEIGNLKTVIVHNPDEGISRISPSRAEEMLFDDIVHLPLMQAEHYTFRKVLNAFLGNDEVLEVQDLIKESLDADTVLKKELLEKALKNAELPMSYMDIFDKMDNQTIAKVLISGYYAEEDHILFDPIPNFVFTRDIATVANDFVVIAKAAKEARYRENLLTRFIFMAHPRFSYLVGEDRLINLNNIEEFPPSKKSEKVSIEGGDMMILEEGYFLIGCSERTTDHAFESLKKALFDRGIVQNVVQVHIPNDRFCMHIDTLFTRIDKDHVVCYKPIVYDGMSSKVEVHNKDGAVRSYASVKDFFLEEINPNMKFIFSGNGESPYQEREQWTDGCNLVCVKPGVGITYDRNLKTEISFREFGFYIMKAEDFLNQVSIDSNFAQNLEKTIITIPSSELSRARGGSHCMTCPILRT